MPTFSFKKFKTTLTSFQWVGIWQILALFLMALALTALIAGSIGYQIGHRQGHSSALSSVSDGSGGQLSPEEIQALRLENDILKTETQTLTQERDISINNLTLLRDETQTLKLTLLKTEQLNQLLTQEIAQKGGVPLKVLGAEIAALPEKGYEYRFDVALFTQDGQSRTLIPSMTLLNETSMVDVPLIPATYDIQGIAHVRGRFIMPDGFVPKQIKLKLVADTEETVQLYDWQVGKAIEGSPATLGEIGDIDTRPINNSKKP